MSVGRQGDAGEWLWEAVCVRQSAGKTQTARSQSPYLLTDDQDDRPVGGQFILCSFNLSSVVMVININKETSLGLECFKIQLSI